MKSINNEDIGLSHAAYLTAGNRSRIPDWCAGQSTSLTKDESFRHRVQQSKTSPVSVWLRIGTTSRKALLHWFEPLMPQLEALLLQGDRVIEVR